MSVIVITDGEKIDISRGEKWAVSSLGLNVIDKDGEDVAAFRRWESVYKPRVPQAAGPFTECTSPDCLKHNGDKSAADAEAAAYWRRALLYVLANDTH